MDLEQITPLVLCYNEKENIVRVLEKLSWARRVVVIDSFSTDSTVELVQSFKNTVIHQRAFDNHENQWNFGLEKVESEWVLSLDADYVVTDSLREEFEALTSGTDVSGYHIAFKYCVFGTPLTGSVLPPRIALFRKDSAKYVRDGHTQRLQVEGKVDRLKNHLLHDDRKPLSRWLRSQDNYMPLEVEKLFSGVPLSFTDKLRKAVFFSPLLMFFYCLIAKGGILDGKRGWFYAYQRMLAEILLSLRIIEWYFEHSGENNPRVKR